MNTRRFLLPLLFAVCALSGCAQPVESPVEEASVPDEKPKAGELPQAPPPHVKKTTAELLLGTWKVVKLNGREVPDDWGLAMEFTADGKLHAFARKPPKARIGTYKLTGELIQFEIPADADDKESRGEMKIISLTEDQLSITSRDKNSRSEEVLQRVKPKQ